MCTLTHIFSVWRRVTQRKSVVRPFQVWSAGLKSDMTFHHRGFHFHSRLVLLCIYGPFKGFRDCRGKQLISNSMFLHFQEAFSSLLKINASDGTADNANNSADISARSEIYYSPGLCSSITAGSRPLQQSFSISASVCMTDQRCDKSSSPSSDGDDRTYIFPSLPVGAHQEPQ